MAKAMSTRRKALLLAVVIAAAALAGTAPQLLDEEDRDLVGAKEHPPAPVLNRRAVASTVAFFCGSAVDYCLVPVARNIDSTDALALLVPGLVLSVVKLACAPAACVQASKASDKYKAASVEPPRNIVWRLYALGWAFAGAAGVFNVIDAFTEETAISNIALGMNVGRDLVWGTACVLSVIYTSRAERHPKLSVSPVVTAKRGYGFAVGYDF